MIKINEAVYGRGMIELRLSADFVETKLEGAIQPLSARVSAVVLTCQSMLRSNRRFAGRFTAYSIA